MTSISDSAVEEYVTSNNSLDFVAKKYSRSGGWLLKQLEKRGIKRRGHSQWKLREKDEKMACTDYENGVPVKVIAEKYRVSRRTITEWIKRGGLMAKPLNLRLGVTAEKKEQARVMYSADLMNCCEIARILGVSSRSVLDWIRDIKRTKSEISAIMASNGKKKSRGNHGSLDTKFGKIWYDSSYERDRIFQLCNDLEVEYVGRCKDRIPYSGKTYNPDLIVKYKCGCVCVEEVKPDEFLKNDKVIDKKNAAILFYKNTGIIYRFVTQKEIYGK